MVGQTNGITQRVDFPFPLIHFGLHIRHVGRPIASRRLLIEGIGVWVDIDTLELTANHSGQHFLQFRILIGQLYVGPHLRTGIPQPHGMDITRVHEGVVRPVEVDGRIQRIREAILKHPCQFRIRQQFLGTLYLLLYGFGSEQTFFGPMALPHTDLSVVPFGYILLHFSRPGLYRHSGNPYGHSYNFNKI